MAGCLALTVGLAAVRMMAGLLAGQWSLLFYCRGDGFRREHLANPRLMCLNSGICDLTLPGLDRPTRP